jgi:hypothetical protein
VNISVTVDDVTLDSVIHEGYENGVTIGDRVVAAIVDRLISDPDRGRWLAMRQQVDKIRDEQIRDAVRPLIEDALAQPFRKTTHYGEPTGPETTLRSLIVQEVQDYLGKPASTSTGRYGEGKTFIASLVAAEVDKAFREEVAEAVKQVRAAVAKEFGDSLSAKFAEVAKEALRSAR